MTGRAAGLGLGLLGALAALSGCAGGPLPERPADPLRGEIAELRREVAEVGGHVGALRGQLEHALVEHEQREREGSAALDRRLGELEARLGRLGDAVAALEGALGGLSDQLGRIETAARSWAATAGRRRPAPAGPTSVSPEERFDRAMESLRRGELGQAVLDLEDFLDGSPGHPLAASARFWVGEAYFRAREWEQAATHYQQAIEAAPEGDKVPEALWKLGLARRALRQEDRAREVWTRLVRDFPTTEAAQKAREALTHPAESR